MTEIAILVPVLDRPHRVRPLVESCAAASTLVRRIVFLVSIEDHAQVSAVRHATLAMPDFVEALLCTFPLGPGDYARKINHGITGTDEEWVLQAADDLRFHPGWDEAAMAKAAPHIGVIGTNDLGNPLTRAGRHATHSLIRRTYVEQHGTIDEPGKALHEGYSHCWVDNELVETAIARRAWASARRSHVEHLHHIWPNGSGGRKGEDDATYRRGQRDYNADASLFKRRRPLWRRGARMAL